jgi:hypothetical protein
VAWDTPGRPSPLGQLAAGANRSVLEDEVDTDRTLPPEERALRAEHAYRAHMVEMSRRSAKARRESLVRRKGATGRKPG